MELVFYTEYITSYSKSFHVLSARLLKADIPDIRRESIFMEMLCTI